MFLMELYSVFMMIQFIPTDNNLWVLLEVLQPLHYKMLRVNQWVNLNYL